MNARASSRSGSFRSFIATTCRVVAAKRFQVDCLWPDQRQIVELDGWQGHKTRTAFREDRARDRRLRVAGYGVTRLTWNQLEDEPESIAADIRVLLQMQK